MHPLRTGMIPPQLPGSPSYLRPGTPALAKFLHDLGYNTGEFGKNHLGDHTDALPTAHGFQEYWGYLYHLDAMQQVSFPDINKSPTVQGIAPPCKNTPIPGLAEVPGAVDPKTTICLTPPRPVLCVQDPPTARQRIRPAQDEGPLTLERSKTVDEEISAKVIDFLDRNDPEEDQQAVLRLVQPGAHARHDGAVRQVLAMVGERGGKDWGVNEAGMKQMDDNIGLVLKKLEDMGQLDNTIVVFTTDNGAEVDHLPRRRRHAVQGQKGEAWEGGYRAPLVVRWPGHIKPGTVKNQFFAVPRLGADAGRHRRRAQRRRAEETDRGRPVSGYRQDDARRRRPARLPGRQAEKSARDIFFYYSGATPSAVRYKNWKMYYTMSQPGPAGWIMPLDPVPLHAGPEHQARSLRAGGRHRPEDGNGHGRCARRPGHRLPYDWNMLPIGQQLWLKELSPTRSSRRCRLRRATTSSSLEQVKKQKRAATRANSRGARDAALKAGARRGARHHSGCV